MVNEKLNKLDGHIQGLLDSFVGLKTKYAYLDPMLFNSGVCKKYGRKNKGNGFETIRNALFFDCIQDIVKLSFDDDCRTPSLINFIKNIENDQTISLIKEKYTEPRFITGLSKEELLNYQIKEKQEKDQEFQRDVNLLLNDWKKYKNEEYVSGFNNIRDKIQAHLELKLVDGNYSRIDISKLNLKWDDPKKAIFAMQNMINILNGLIRRAEYAFRILDEQNTYYVNAYWDCDIDL